MHKVGDTTTPELQICKSLSDCSWKLSSCEFFLGCVIETDKKREIGGGKKKKKKGTTLIKIATENQELHPVIANQNTFIKPMEK